MGKFDGKTILITGGGKEKSVGYGVASAFAREGANLFICGINKHKLRAAKELKEKFEVQVETYQMQGFESQDVIAAVERACGLFQRIDVLICCIQPIKMGNLFDKTCDEDFDTAFDRLAGFYFRWMRACYPYLKKTHGSVVAFTSASAESGTEGMLNLAASSGAIEGMCKVAAREWVSDGINVHTFRASVRTAQFERLARQFPDDYESLGGDVAFAELVDVDDVGAACVSLAYKQVAS